MNIDIMTDTNEEKISKVKGYLENILGTNVDVILNVLDPRVNHFDCFANVENFDLIKNTYPNAKENESDITVYLPENTHINFTLYKVNESNKEEIMNKVQSNFEAQKQETQDMNVKF